MYVLTPGFTKGSFNHPTVPMHFKLLLSAKNLGRFVSVWTTGKLNSITIRDAFPLFCIAKALQAVHNCNVFTSFDLVQGHLQLAMAEDDIRKTTFRAGASGLYEFTHMPFGLSNAWSSFCQLMKQCPGVNSLSPSCCI